MHRKKNLSELLSRVKGRTRIARTRKDYESDKRPKWTTRKHWATRTSWTCW